MSLTARSLFFRYGTHALLQDIDLDVPPGAVLAIVGPNGSGKSTLLRCLAQALRPQGGQVLLDGEDLYALPPRRVARQVAFLPQDSPVGFGFTARELVSLGSAGGAAPGMVEASLEAMDLKDLAERSLLTLSGGERQRAAIARVLAQDTPYLLLDEPTAHLDLRHQSRLLQIVHAYAHERGRSVALVLHDLNHAAQIADRVALIHDGRVFAEGAPEQVFTADTLRHVYQTDVYIAADPATGRPWVLPERAAPSGEPGPDLPAAASRSRPSPPS